MHDTISFRFLFTLLFKSFPLIVRTEWKYSSFIFLVYFVADWLRLSFKRNYFGISLFLSKKYRIPFHPRSCCLHIFMLHSFRLIKYLYLYLETNRKKIWICFTNLFDVYISQIVSVKLLLMYYLHLRFCCCFFYFSFHSQRVTENWYALYQSQ